MMVDFCDEKERVPLERIVLEFTAPEGAIVGSKGTPSSESVKASCSTNLPAVLLFHLWRPQAVTRFAKKGN